MRGPPPPVPKLKPALGGADGGCCVVCCPNPPLPNAPGAGFCAGGAVPPKGIGDAPGVGWVEPKVAFALLKVLPKGCVGAAAGAPNGTGAAAGVEPKGTGAAACVAEPNCIGALAPNGAEGVDPNPELGPGAGVEPKAAGAGAVEPNVGAFGAGAGVEPNVKGAAGVGAGAAGAGAGMDPNVKGAADGVGAGAGAGVDPNVNEGTAGVGAGAGVDPNVNEGAGGLEAGTGAGVEPKARGAAGAGVDPKLGAGAEVAEADKELFEGFPKPGVLMDELSPFEELLGAFPKTKGAGVPAFVAEGADAAGGSFETAAVGGSLEAFVPKDILCWLEDAAFRSSLLRRFFFDVPPSLPSVATLPRGGIEPLIPPIDDPAPLGIENFGVVAESRGAEDVLAELPPKENPGVEASADVVAPAELPPKVNGGAPCLSSLSVVVELEKLKPLLLSAFASFRFGSGTVVGAFSDPLLRVGLPEPGFKVGATSLFVPKVNLGVSVELEVDEVAKLPNSFAPLLISVDSLGAAAFSTDFGDGAGAELKENFGVAFEDSSTDDKFFTAVAVVGGDFGFAGALN